MDCVHRQCFLEVFLSPCCDFHYSSIPVCDVPSKGPKITASSVVFRPWPLRTEIVPDSLNLWMILCTVDDDNFKLFAIFLWENPFWYCSTIFRRSIGGIGDPLPILTSERHCHSERLFLYPIMLNMVHPMPTWSPFEDLEGMGGSRVLGCYARERSLIKSTASHSPFSVPPL